MAHLSTNDICVEENMNKTINIWKFPRTRHLLDSGGSSVTRDDLLMSKKEADVFVKKNLITVEEKIDGANLGISMSKDFKIMAQNRSHFVTSSSHRQFATLDSWISTNSTILMQILSNGKYILFGEWMYAKHSIFYTCLPNHFIAFDMFDVENQKFLSRRTRNVMLEGSGIPCVPFIVEKEFKNKDELLSLLESRSSFYQGPVEGVYLRIDGDTQNDSFNQSVGRASYLLNRAKIVRADFSQNIEEQWTRQKFTKNICMNYY